VVPPAPGYIQLGVSIEPLAELSAKEGSRLGGDMGQTTPGPPAAAAAGSQQPIDMIAHALLNTLFWCPCLPVTPAAEQIL
jgi:hypothetical protein